MPTDHVIDRYFQNSLATVQEGRIFLKDGEVTIDIEKVKRIVIIKETKEIQQLAGTVFLSMLLLVLVLLGLSSILLSGILLLGCAFAGLLVYDGRKRYWLTFTLDMVQKKQCIPIHRNEVREAEAMISHVYKYKFDLLRN